MKYLPPMPQPGEDAGLYLDRLAKHFAEWVNHNLPQKLIAAQSGELFFVLSEDAKMGDMIEIDPESGFLRKKRL